MNEWFKNIIEVAAAVGTLWAAISARQSAKTSAKQLDTQINEQEKVERPRIVPLNKQVSAEIPFPLVDWSRDDHGRLNLFVGYSKFSEFTIPIINTGKSFALNVGYCYEIEGGIEAIEDKAYDDHYIIGPSAEERIQKLDQFEFSIRAIDYRNSAENRILFIAEVIPYINYIPIVQSNATEQLQIPSYFVALSNVYLLNCWDDRPDNELIRPKLTLTIFYKDQFNNEHEDKFRMQLGGQMSQNGSITKAWIEFENKD
ncbi:hypothetical protein [Exiguobacterium sp. s138]|uniref:hypothetical protein n=1 Tax=Exiguobacterium sp. s138 TaxID=2751202 RepID=UPI001BE63AC2|nr:hypothetical protein [Exiguobacterium sp. s138]